MKKRSIHIYVLICISLITFLSCSERNSHSVTDAVPENNILSTNSSFNNISSIVHPGILNSQASLDFIKSNMDTYRQQAYNTIDYGDFVPPNAVPTVYVRNTGDATDSEKQFENDALLAYAYALRWANDGQSSDATNAKNILNDWAGTFDAIKICKDPEDDAASDDAGCPSEVPACENDPEACIYPMGFGEQRYLEASWVAPNFAAAAEIIRDYDDGNGGAGWSSNDAEDFEDFLELLYNDYIKTIANGIQENYPRPTGPPWNWSWSNNNWGASAVWAKMAIAAYTGKVNWFNDALEKAGYLIENIIHSSTGEPTETNRDCNHPQASLTALTYAAETAKIQGDNSLYGNFDGSTLKKGWEWMSDAYPGTDPVTSSTCKYDSKNKIFPGVEVAYDYYQSNDIEDLRDQEEPYGIVSRKWIGFTTYTHYETPLPATATTAAIHKPTSNTQVSVIYEGESTAVNYNSGESLDNMLTKMKNAINADQNIEITAEANLTDNTITFIEKTPGSFANSNNVTMLFFTADWQNGVGFSPSPTSMSGGSDN